MNVYSHFNSSFYLIEIVGAKQMPKNNSAAFRNSVRLMGEFYYKARLGNGQQMVFLQVPLLSYMEMLLESANLENIQLFTMQVN